VGGEARSLRRGGVTLKEGMAGKETLVNCECHLLCVRGVFVALVYAPHAATTPSLLLYPGRASPGRLRERRQGRSGGVRCLTADGGGGGTSVNHRGRGSPALRIRRNPLKSGVQLQPMLSLADYTCPDRPDDVTLDQRFSRGKSPGAQLVR
jgi:hypothetical protein